MADGRPLRISAHLHGETVLVDRPWRCEKCFHWTEAKINPVECPACDGEMVRAPQER